MNILIVNLHSAHNAGDHVLMDVAIEELRASFPGCRLTLAMNDPDSYQNHADDIEVVESFFAWYKQRSFSGAIQRGWRMLVALLWIVLSVPSALLYRYFNLEIYLALPGIPRRSLRAYYDADLVVSCPGNFLYSRGYAAGLPFLLPVFTIAFGWLAAKPVQMMPQTIGPIWRGWERRALKWLLARVRLILLRDATSVALMEELDIPKDRYRLTPDLAFLFDGAPARDGVALLAQFGVDVGRAENQPRLGVTLIDWGRQNPLFTGQRGYEAAVAATIAAFLRENGGEAVLFAQVCGPTDADDDRIPARRVRDLLSGTDVAERVTVIDVEVQPDVLKAAYGQMDILLGSRLHSNIFALTARVPVVAVAYQPKTNGVMQMLGQGDRVVEIEDVTADALIHQVAQAWAEHDALPRIITARITDIRCEAVQAAAWMRDDYDADCECS